MAKDFGFTPYTGEQPFVFISYKSEESEVAASFAAHLHDSGINVYYDNALQPGDSWAKTLLDTIGSKSCVGVILIASRRSLASKPVEDEVQKAHYSHKSVLAVFIEEPGRIEEPMNTFLSGTHSVLAWQLPDSEAKAQVLAGAEKMLAGSKKPASNSGSADKLHSAGRMFLMNYGRSRSAEDIECARKQFLSLTEEYPTDYRGWLCLALCECMGEPQSLQDAAARLGQAAKHYSYVVSLRADDAASPEYTQVKSEFWLRILALLETGMDSCTDAAAARQFRETAVAIGSRFGHTRPDISQRYSSLMEAKKDEWEQTIARLEKAGISALFIRKDISPAETRLVGIKPDALLPAELIIPGELEGRTVTGIGSNAFKGCAGIKTVVIPDSVRRIGKRAFEGCTGLESVTIANKKTRFGGKVFRGCPALTLYGTGGVFSRTRKAARKNRIKYVKIK